MFVRVVNGEVSVEEADDLTRLSVVTELDDEGTRAELRRVGLGDLRAGEAQLNVEALRADAEARATTKGWTEGWDKMIEYATSKSWVSADGTTVQAHVELA